MMTLQRIQQALLEKCLVPHALPLLLAETLTGKRSHYTLTAETLDSPQTTATACSNKHGTNASLHQLKYVKPSSSSVWYDLPENIDEGTGLALVLEETQTMITFSAKASP